jgi:hypothetical protein
MNYCWRIRLSDLQSLLCKSDNRIRQQYPQGWRAFLAGKTEAIDTSHSCDMFCINSLCLTFFASPFLNLLEPSTDSISMSQKLVNNRAA